MPKHPDIQTSKHPREITHTPVTRLVNPCYYDENIPLYWTGRSSAYMQFGHPLTENSLPLHPVFFDPVGVRRHTVPQIKGLIKPDWNQKIPRAWQHYFPLPCPLEKTPFHREKGNRTKTFVLGCKLYVPQFWKIQWNNSSSINRAKDKSLHTIALFPMKWRFF